MPTITLKRSGQPPLRFEGELLAQVDGYSRPNEPPRWHELAVYRTAAGRYVVGATLRTRWEGEADQWFAEHADTATEIADLLRAHDPCPAGIGYPPGPSFAERQARVEADLRRRYDATVTELFERLGAEFAERVS